MEVLHISCNMCTQDLPDMYALSPWACSPWAYISGKSLVPMLQFIHARIDICSYACVANYIVDTNDTYIHMSLIVHDCFYVEFCLQTAIWMEI